MIKLQFIQKVMIDLTGIFGKYKSSLSHPENFHVLGSNFNLLKKDDINAESFLSHLIHGTIDQQKKYYTQSFNNLYATNIIKKEWRGHLEAITSIEFIEEPICLVTVSKDLHLRIWDEKMELIVSSNRIDTVVSNICHIGRNNISDMIKKKEILLNYEFLKDSSYKLKDDDTFSIKRIGKFKYNGILKNTKSNHLIIEILKYI